MQRMFATILVLLLAGCSSSEEPRPAAAVALETYLNNQVEATFLSLAEFEAMLPLLRNPDAAANAGIVFSLDDSVGAEPNTYNFTIPIDADGDGQNDTALTGTGVLSDDPLTAFGPGFSGVLDITIDVLNGQGTVTALLNIEFTADGYDLSGDGTFSDNLAGQAGEFHIDPASPLVIDTHAANEEGNLCRVDAQGPVEITSGPIGVAMAQASSSTALPAGFLRAIWNFIANSKTVQVRDVAYADPVTGETSLSDRTVQLPACGGGIIDDWVGGYLQDWSCIPTESGSAELTLTKTGQNTIHIVDEDPPGSGDINEYDATADDANPHTLRGSFQGGTGDYVYTEEFVWTLNSAGNIFTDSSIYTYDGGPLVGQGGICNATATKQP